MFGRKRKASEFDTPYTCTAALTKGAPETKLSMFVMGLGSFVHGQRIKGLLYLAAEAAYIVFMIMTGLHCLYMLGSLGTVEQQEYWDEAQQVYLYTQGDQSITILLYGVATIFVTLLMVYIWRGSLKSAYKAECLAKQGKHVNTFAEDLKSLLDENLHKLLMTPPLFFIFALTVLPLAFMICMAFTNYSLIDNHLVLFDWVGLDNFKTLFDSSSVLGSTFWSVLIWTIVWAFFATFSNYICGMILSSDHQPERDKGKRLLAFLLCAFLRGSDVRISADYAYHAAAGRRGQRTAEKHWSDRSGRQSSVLYGSHLGACDGNRDQYLGWRAVYSAAADRRSPEHSGGTLRSGESGRSQRRSRASLKLRFLICCM